MRAGWEAAAVAKEAVADSRPILMLRRNDERWMSPENV
jgi:hypothetical protein